MTIARALSQARRYARVDTTGADDTQVQNLIQDSVDQFSRDIGGFPIEAFLSITAEFTTKTNYAIHVTIIDSGSTVVDTDVPITGTDRTDATGTTVASDLQIAIRAMTGATGTETVVWSTDGSAPITGFYFTIDFKQGSTSAGDSITVSAPTDVQYVDATELLGLISPGVASTIITGTFPEDCTVKADLPSDAMKIDRVEWDEWELYELPQEYAQSPESFGDPRWFYVRGRELYMIPSPDRQEKLHVWYRGIPTAIDFDTDVNLPNEIPSMYHNAIPFLASYYMLLETHEPQKAAQFYGQYRQIMTQYKVDYGNNHTQVDENFGGKTYRIPRVTM